MNRSFEPKAPRPGSVRIGSFGRKPFKRISEVSLNDLCKHLVYANNTDTVVAATSADVFVVSGTTKASLKTRRKGEISSLSLRGDDKLLALCIDKVHIEIVDLGRRKSISSFSVPDPLLAIKFASNGRLMGVSADKFFTVDNLGNIFDVLVFGERVKFAFFLSDQYSVLSGSSVMLFNHHTSEMKSLCALDSVDCCALADDRLAMSSEGVAYVYDIKHATLECKWRIHSKTMTHLDMANDKGLLFSTSLDGFCTITDARTGQSKHLVNTSSPILCASRKGKDLIAIGKSDSSLAIYSTKTGKAHHVESAPDTAASQKTITTLLRSFKYRKALTEALNHASTDVFVNVLTMLNYNNHLETLCQSLDSDTLHTLARRLCKVSLGSKISSVIVSSLAMVAKTNCLSHEDLLLLRDRLEFLGSIQTSMASLAACVDIYMH